MNPADKLAMLDASTDIPAFRQHLIVEDPRD
jgi:hypothetical protein